MKDPQYNAAREPSQKDLRLFFRYDEEIGALYYLPRSKWTRADRVGCLAGYVHPNGYWYVKIRGVPYLAHRLIWVYHFGSIPAGFGVDHRNAVRSDNHIENLQLATRVGNGQNRTLSRNNRSGVRGVSFDRTWRKWIYERRFAGRRHRKAFRTKGEAIIYALKWERTLQEFQTRSVLQDKEEQSGIG